MAKFLEQRRFSKCAANNLEIFMKRHQFHRCWGCPALQILLVVMDSTWKIQAIDLSFTSVSAWRWREQPQRLGRRWTGIGSPACTRCCRSGRIALPEIGKTFDFAADGRHKFALYGSPGCLLCPRLRLGHFTKSKQKHNIKRNQFYLLSVYGVKNC